ncbi:MAG: FeoA family protein [Eubacterium sp.]|uniref:FeoA family protein n=1 Tax=Eubacterium sp. TaxID=142586 RepID=UPI003A49BC4B
MKLVLLSMADYGDKRKIISVTGREETKHHLEALGFIEGEEVTVVSSLSGNLIVNVKGTRIAISRSIANKIIV